MAFFAIYHSGDCQSSWTWNGTSKTITIANQMSTSLLLIATGTAY